ncbi:hypothetical protein V3C99_010605 [Haemonchus contortus]
MPPKKSSSDAAPSWLQPILERWDEYFERFDRVFELFIKMQESQSHILEKLNAIDQKLSARTDQSDNSRSALYSTLVKFKADSKIVDEKACRITWVGIGEQATEAATNAYDKEALKEVIVSSGDQELLNEFNSGRIVAHRYPKTKPVSKNPRPRIIKISLGSQRLRDRLLDHMRAGRLSLTKDFVHSYARTDYTKEELAYDRSLRQKAGIMNREEGKLSYVVRDLAIHKLRTPRDLPACNLVSHSSQSIDRSDLTMLGALPALHGQINSSPAMSPVGTR